MNRNTIMKKKTSLNIVFIQWKINIHWIIKCLRLDLELLSAFQIHWCVFNRREHSKQIYVRFYYLFIIIIFFAKYNGVHCHDSKHVRHCCHCDTNENDKNDQELKWSHHKLNIAFWMATMKYLWMVENEWKSADCHV